MPVFDQGYQHWDGALSGNLWRWWAITRRGVKAQLKNRWVISTLILAWLPALVLTAVLAIWGLIEQKSTLIAPYIALVTDSALQKMFSEPHYFRAMVWTIAFDFFFRCELFFSMVLVVLVGPDLISQDLRFNAMPLYFSRPLRRIDYFLGKLGVIAAFLLAVTAAPSLGAWLLGVLFSLDVQVLRDTSRLFAACAAYSILIAASAGTLMLAISSLTRSSRFVGAIWIGLWVVSNIMATAMDNILQRDWCPVIAYTTNLQRLGQSFLGTYHAYQQVLQLVTQVEKIASLPMGAMMSRRRQGGGFLPPPPPSPEQLEKMSPRRARNVQRNSPYAEPYPWTWSAGVLAGMFILSMGILTMRVKSLDKLR